jgi:hypothetical protein
MHGLSLREYLKHQAHHNQNGNITNDTLFKILNQSPLLLNGADDELNWRYSFSGSV